MKHSAVTPQPLCTQSRDLRRHHEIVPTSVRTPSAEDRAFIQAMNEFVENTEPLQTMNFSGYFDA